MIWMSGNQDLLILGRCNNLKKKTELNWGLHWNVNILSPLTLGSQNNGGGWAYEFLEETWKKSPAELSSSANIVM